MNSILKKLNLNSSNFNFKAFKTLFKEHLDYNLKFFHYKNLVSNGKVLKEYTVNELKTIPYIAKYYKIDIIYPKKDTKTVKVGLNKQDLYIGLGVYSIVMLLNSSSNSIFFYLLKNVFISQVAATMLFSTNHLVSDTMDEKYILDKLPMYETIRFNLMKSLGLMITSLYISNPITSLIGYYLMTSILLNSTKTFYEQTEEGAIKQGILGIGLITLIFTFLIMFLKSIRYSYNFVKQISHKSETSNNQ